MALQLSYYVTPPFPLHPCPPLLSSRWSRRGTLTIHATNTTAAAVPTVIADELWEWFCKSAGTSSSRPPSVKPSFVKEGLGLVAQRDLSRKEVVLEVPKKLWIDSDAVAASDIGGACGGVGPTWVSVALFLLRERSLGRGSPWHPYLSSLPADTNSPIFWSEEELAQIEGTQLLSTTVGTKEYVQSEFIKVEDEVVLPNKHLFPSTITATDFLWAFGILRSRAFSGLRGENLALIPLADLVRS